MRKEIAVAGRGYAVGCDQAGAYFLLYGCKEPVNGGVVHAVIMACVGASVQVGKFVSEQVVSTGRHAQRKQNVTGFHRDLHRDTQREVWPE